MSDLLLFTNKLLHAAHFTKQPRPVLPEKVLTSGRRILLRKEHISSAIQATFDYWDKIGVILRRKNLVVGQPHISIVTPCLNRATLVREAIQSVLDQNYTSFEHIVADGGSTDGTLEILGAYPHLRVDSGPDSGMYSAINKGIRMARGEILGLLNSDDLYEPRAFEIIDRAFHDHPDILAVVGGTRVFRDVGAAREYVRQRLWIEEHEVWQRLTLGALNTNAWFFRRNLFERIGYFEERYRFSGDREFLLRMAAAMVGFLPVKEMLYLYREHTESITFNPASSRDLHRAETRLKVLREGMLIAESYLNKPNLPPMARYYLHRLHDDRTYRLTATALYHKKWLVARTSAAAGWRYNPLWPIVFMHRALRRLVAI